MAKKEYLNEEEYGSTKKRLSMIAMLILVFGVVIGGGLIVTGIVKSSNVVSSSQNGRTKEVIQKEIDDLNKELSSLMAKQTEEFEKNQFSALYYSLQSEIFSKSSKISDLETELWEGDSGYNSTKDSMSKAKYIPFYIFGAFIIIASCMGSFSVYIFSKGREITAFTMQQVMPVATEGMEKVAPSIGKVAKEISKGIKDGLKDDE